MLLVALVAVAFGGFLLFMIEQSDLVGLATISEPLRNPLKNRYIQINFPKAGAIITNPVLISGKADCSKTALGVKIKDSKQMELAKTSLAPAGSQICVFSDKVRFKKPAAKGGFVEIYQITKDGSEANRITIPVRFAD